MSQNNVARDFENLPYRIFLDSNVLQCLQQYGEFIWENVEISLPSKHSKNIKALKNIFGLNFRTSLEFALSNNSIKEVSDKNDSFYLQWAFDVLDHWMSCIDTYKNSEAFSKEGERLLHQLNEESFNYLSKKDKALIFDAVALECHAFLSMDQKLCSHKKHLEQLLPLEILQPFEYWELLKPFASLWL